MIKLRKKIYATASYNTRFFGPGSSDFTPESTMPGFLDYLKEAANGVCAQLENSNFDEAYIANFMGSRFINQAHMGAFMPSIIPELNGKPTMRVEAACASGSMAIAAAVRSILSDMADSVFVCGLEIQNTCKPLYGADILAGAAYHEGQRKDGHAFFFPGLFSDRAGAYFKKYGQEESRSAMALWYQQAIENAKHYTKAQEYSNQTMDLYKQAMLPPSETSFLEHLTPYDCSKISDGASAIVICSAEGLEKLGKQKYQAVEISSILSSVEDITEMPSDLTVLSNTSLTAQRFFHENNLRDEIAMLEIHDCFSITALLMLEALGFASAGNAAELISLGETKHTGKLPVNSSGGLIGFGHPTAATGVRQLVDLHQQFTGSSENNIQLKSNYGMMVNMGGNDKSVTMILIQKTN
ncbi:MAG: 3-ketoacyl-CoA thiolase [Lentisphaeria bacterium]|nr:3-ketoacyl-CoA thiolase [Lentisphaeria bacterium]NQZ67843.1 3-ketoacyl-CoA thiolase [Lentisphaeria bacterium]